MSRRDDVSELYRPSKSLERACIILFCVNVLISVVSIYVPNAISIITIILVIISFFYMALSLIDDGVLWFRAESARRKNSLQVAYSVRLDKYETDGYYNNKINDPELSYAANQFESIFYTKTISEKMMVLALGKILVVLLILFVSCRLISNNHILLIISQTAFSSVVIEESVRCIVFALRIRKLYDEAYHEFVTVGITGVPQRVWVKYFCIEYECIKAHYRVRLDSSLFNKLNTRLAGEWEDLSAQIKTSGKQ